MSEHSISSLQSFWAIKGTSAAAGSQVTGHTGSASVALGQGWALLRQHSSTRSGRAEGQSLEEIALADQPSEDWERKRLMADSVLPHPHPENA